MPRKGRRRQLPAPSVPAHVCGGLQRQPFTSTLQSCHAASARATAIRKKSFVAAVPPRKRSVAALKHMATIESIVGQLSNEHDMGLLGGSSSSPSSRSSSRGRRTSNTSRRRSVSAEAIVISTPTQALDSSDAGHSSGEEEWYEEDRKNADIENTILFIEELVGEELWCYSTSQLKKAFKVNFASQLSKHPGLRSCVNKAAEAGMPETVRTYTKVQVPPDMLLLLFAGRWCPLCVDFANRLRPIYAGIKGMHVKARKCELILVSCDVCLDGFQEYFLSLGPEALAIPFYSPKIQQIISRYEVVGMPTLLVIDAETGRVVSASGREEVAEKKVPAIDEVAGSDTRESMKPSVAWALVSQWESRLKKMRDEQIAAVMEQVMQKEARRKFQAASDVEEGNRRGP
mmetsp:Transcript_114927/g.324817  ORF Transcript_114927/g.324817 Transcript_114927/m.324817 type:complete len:401 (-) Transcript_114927:286-1488(-)